MAASFFLYDVVLYDPVLSILSPEAVQAPEVSG